MSSTPIVATLLDPFRLMVAGSLVATVRTAAEVAERTGAEQRDVIAAIGTLREVGLVDQQGEGYTLSSASLQRLVNELAETDVDQELSGA